MLTGPDGCYLNKANSHQNPPSMSRPRIEMQIGNSTPFLYTQGLFQALEAELIW